MDFFIGGNLVGDNIPVLEVDSNYVATFFISTLALGTHQVTATYSGHGYDVYQWATGDNLSNGGETVTLKDTFNQTVDTVSYDDVAPWPTEPDGSGPSLALLDPALDNSAAANWAKSREDGGTPGAVNFPPLPPVPVGQVNEPTM